MYGDTLGNISSGLFSVERNGEIHGINLKLYCDLQYSYDVICQKMIARVSSGVPDTEKQLPALAANENFKRKIKGCRLQ